jgi:hypothetical protein
VSAIAIAISISASAISAVGATISIVTATTASIAAAIVTLCVVNTTANRPFPTRLSNFVSTTPHEAFNLHFGRSNKLPELRDKRLLERIL